MRSPIGIFDSGYGGLTVFRSIAARLPQYDYIYLGDNARAPYGTRSTEVIHKYTLQCVEWLFAQGCPLVILACNTASAGALRTIQQQDLPLIAPDKRVLGVIRPSAEVIGKYTRTGHVAVLGTISTVHSMSYVKEINNFYPDIHVHQKACPMWVALIENGEYNSEAAHYLVKKYMTELMEDAPEVDTVLLGCTHYPLLMDKIKKYLPEGMNIIAQGEIVANSLVDYLQRHPEMETRLSKNGSMEFFTTDDAADFNEHATVFFGKEVLSHHLQL